MTLHLVTAVPNVVEQFLDFIYGADEGYAYSPIRNPTLTINEDGYWTQEFFKWPEEKSLLIEYIKLKSSQFDVYISPGLFNTPSSRKDSFKSSKTVWAEFDGKLPTEEDLRKAGIPKPNLRIRSSQENYEHWYWICDSNSTVDVESINRRITYLLGADSSGWDCNQVLRLPGTFNHKRDKVLVGNPNYYIDDNAFDFSTIIAGVDFQPVLDINVDNLPDVTSVVLKYAWPEFAGKHYLTPNFPVGTRSEALMKLGYYCVQMGMSDDESYSILYNADSRWQKFNSRTDRLQRLSEIISRARLKYPKRNSSSAKLEVFGTLTLIRSDRQIEWLIPGLLESMGSMLLVGPSGVGKTQFTLNCAICLALGQPFLNFEISAPTKLLFASLEMGYPQIKWLVEQVTQNLELEQLLLLEKNLQIIPLGESLPLNKEQGQKELENLLNEHKPNGFIVDSLGSAIKGSLTKHEDVEGYIDWTDRVRNKFGVFSWGIHHMRKANGENKKPNKLEDVYGDQYITARATSVYCLWPTKTQDNLEVIPLKKRMSKLESSWLIKRTKDLNFEKVTIQEKLTNKLKPTAVPPMLNGLDL